MLKNLGAKSAFMMFVTAAVAFSFAPAIQATPVNYDFSVRISSGLLEGTTADGSFSYDDSSIVSGRVNKATNLLTNLDFTLNGISYNADTANTGYLSFDAAGNLIDFWFGNNCRPGNCGLIPRGDSWFVHNVFGYTALKSNGRPGKPGAGNVSYSLAPPAPEPVPEPGTLGLFGLGALMIGLLAGVRRRMY